MVSKDIKGNYYEGGDEWGRVMEWRLLLWFETECKWLWRREILPERKLC